MKGRNCGYVKLRLARPGTLVTPFASDITHLRSYCLYLNEHRSSDGTTIDRMAWNTQACSYGFLRLAERLRSAQDDLADRQHSDIDEIR